MSKGRDRIVYKRADGTWANKRNDAERPSSVHETQGAAEQAARDMLKNQGGGELTTKGRNGVIRSKDSIAPWPHLKHSLTKCFVVHFRMLDIFLAVYATPLCGQEMHQMHRTLTVDSSTPILEPLDSTSNSKEADKFWHLKSILL